MFSERKRKKKEKRREGGRKKETKETKRREDRSRLFPGSLLADAVVHTTKLSCVRRGCGPGIWGARERSGVTEYLGAD